jgi:outer membrane protein OmpA-like peptidoglycan-associated protein
MDAGRQNCTSEDEFRRAGEIESCSALRVADEFVLLMEGWKSEREEWDMGSRGLKSICLSLMAIGLAFVSVGCKKVKPITLACNATPPTVYAGEQVTATATAASISTIKRTNLAYSWSGSGVTAIGSAATIATDTLNPGSYTVKAEVKEGKKGKEGLKPGETAECSTGFTVKDFEPPTVSCLANPSTLKPGDTSTITCTGASPQNRPLTYTYSAAAGTISGVDSTATFSSNGAPAGPVAISCNVSDDKNHTAKADTSVTIVAPPLPVPHVQALCSISFARDTRRPTRVDNEARACLDQIALELKKFPDAKAVIVADSNEREKQITAKQEKIAARHKHSKVKYFDQQRAVNVKDYLVNDQGIDPSRISVATGTGDDENVQNYLVPADATFEKDEQGTTAVEESAVKPEERKPLPVRHHKKATANQQ